MRSAILCCHQGEWNYARRGYKLKDAYYFPHDANARSDPKIMALIKKYGIEGYGRFWIVIEMLRDQQDYQLKMCQYVTNALAMAMLCEEKEAAAYIDDCINEFELFVSDGEYFWSESLRRRMSQKDAKREKRAEAGKKGAQVRWGKYADKQGNNGNAIAMPCETNGKNGKVKESKEEESKLNNKQQQQDSNSNLESNSEDTTAADKWIEVDKTFTRLTGVPIPSPRDVQAMKHAVAMADNQTDLIIEVMEACYKNFKPPYPGAKIRSFRYFLPAIQEAVATVRARSPSTKDKLTEEERAKIQKLTQELTDLLPDELREVIDSG